MIKPPTGLFIKIARDIERRVHIMATKIQTMDSVSSKTQSHFPPRF
jgi:hypothetical protein